MSKIGNNHSDLLNQLLKAAEKAAPKQAKSDFINSCIKIASEPEPTLKDTLNKIASNINAEKRMRKTAQMDMGGPAAPASPAPDLDSEPDFGAMAGDAPPDLESGLDTPEMPESDVGGDVEAAKKSLADALIALCGGVDQAVDCLQGGELGGEEPELGDPGLDSELTEEPSLDDEGLGDDLIPDDLLQETNEMPKPMSTPPASPMM